MIFDVNLCCIHIKKETIETFNKHAGATQVVVEPAETFASPPTYFKIDKVTSVFQGIVNTYGVPRYKV